MIIPTVRNTKTITDLRENALELLNQAKKTGPTFIFHRSKPRAVMLSVEEYSNMMEMLEDYFDSLKAMELEENPQKDGITLEALIKQYKLI
ncbi:MAG: type II toxin-antitoxin system prevent-host-death family antitoxin [Candidatus Daviesbacteria bacterium]|nr:type II toxin-antitoxin system prevent-host-death family antitoxin [Candidatus Daviesbacteria bacterium]